MVGAVAGGFVSISTDRMQSSLWVVGGLELAIAGAWGFGRLLGWRTDEVGDDRVGMLSLRLVLVIETSGVHRAQSLAMIPLPSFS